MEKKINIQSLVGKGYKEFWDYKGRYRIVKGGRGSKKSTTTSLYYIIKLMEYYELYKVKPNLLVIRRYYNTHRDSTFAQLKWAIARLGVDHLWKATKSPLELVYLPSNQKIMFRGLDDPQSITSITTTEGNLCWVWWEEAFQITNEEDFNKVDLSIRGELPPQLFKQHTLTLNPWSDKIWIKRAFFDKVKETGLSKDSDILAITRNYDCNEFLGIDDIRIFEKMKEENPRRYGIEGLGEWGIAEGLVYENWQELEFDFIYMKRQLDENDNLRYKQLAGLDFGYTNDPTAFIALLADIKDKKIYIYDEFYKTRMKNKDIAETLILKDFKKARIIADSADPKSIDELKDLGLRIVGAKKGKGSVKAGIQKLQDYKIYVHPKCANTIIELNNYIWDKDKDTGRPSTDPIDNFNHLMDALRYATEELNRENFSW